MEKNKVFLDTSVFITALLSSKGGSFYILNNLRGRFEFQINHYIFQEIQQLLDNKFYSQNDLKSKFFLLIGLAKIKIFPNPAKKELKLVNNIINKKDLPILTSAMKKSDYLLTLDKDFLNEKVINFAKKKNLIILTPKEFILRFRK